MTIQHATCLLAITFGLACSVQAAPSTPNGEISAAQVIEMIQRAPKDKAARNAAMAYLAGVGETTGLLVAQARQRSTASITCTKPLGISGEAALTALLRLDQKVWAKTAATPILVDDMLKRAGCR